MDPINLAVISDLHIGHGRSKDLWIDQTRTAEEQKELDRLTESDFIEKFKKFVKHEKITADYLIIPGDISNTAEHSQFNLASTIIEEIASSLKVSLENILYVPGNHDLDWEMIKRNDPTKFYKKLRYVALEDKTLIFEKIMENLEGHVLKEPWFSIWDKENLFTVGYNSAWEDDPTKYPHHGAITQEHLEKIEEFLKTTNLPVSKLKLFLVHHHPFNHTDPDPDYRDFSIMGNSENLLKVLRKYKFDLIIHGHKHWPKFTIDYTNTIFPIAVFGAGSFSAQIYSGWQGKVDNQFHLIQVKGRNKDNHTIYGKLLSWAFLAAHGWVVSNKKNGIEHISPFGCYFQPQEIKETIKKEILEGFSTKNYIKWSELVDLADHLKNLHTDTRDFILNELEDEIGFIKHEIETDLIFIPKK